MRMSSPKVNFIYLLCDDFRRTLIFFMFRRALNISHAFDREIWYGLLIEHWGLGSRLTKRRGLLCLVKAWDPIFDCYKEHPSKSMLREREIWFIRLLFDMSDLIITRAIFLHNFSYFSRNTLHCEAPVCPAVMGMPTPPPTRHGSTAG